MRALSSFARSNRLRPGWNRAGLGQLAGGGEIEVPSMVHLATCGFQRGVGDVRLGSTGPARRTWVRAFNPTHSASGAMNGAPKIFREQKRSEEHTSELQ